MDTCVYCGKSIKQVDCKVKVSKKKYIVCSDVCCENTLKYVERDKKYKKVMYLGIFIPAVLILFNLLLEQGMKLVYLMQVVVGIIFILFPYPNVSFQTFSSVSVRGVIRICRILGIIFTILGLYLFITV
ncbi:hypothetical protein GC105_10090 [Alkalibaculum sp. M08DMB]|uniref:Uncharacterized protein n=1 Tax=Alkalibaculum sporogenes TaxID=2655001 RepID=A0A6A7K9E9_9FIRM|nr:hypothetical protein [Alkalibaculum sporogenes]MPW26139.1 hypothetical protein [Alkalibaculum sporogenes]